MWFDDGSMQLIRGWNRVRYIGGLDRWRTCSFGSNPLLRRDHRLLSPAVGAPAVVWNPNSFPRRVGCGARGRLEEVGGGAEIGVRAILENADAAALAARVLRDAVDNVGAGRDHEGGWSPPPSLSPAAASFMWRGGTGLPPRDPDREWTDDGGRRETTTVSGVEEQGGGADCGARRVRKAGGGRGRGPRGGRGWQVRRQTLFF